ncbi:MAG: CooT family nickel-binding protein [Thermodesulfobacteriota bacterium]
MCEANAYLVRESGEELVMESVDVLEPRGDRLYLRSIFGDQKLIPARLKTTSLLEHRILLEPTEAP